ncbi:MAG: glycerophosphodiester phosphodiesterase family protein [Rhizobiaceae bacterium]|nr:glycerophosphodiester phosphodiesterase family protein [Rhizobiaceae bacterium]
MSTNPLLQTALWVTDFVFASIPRKTPSIEAFANCKIVSHRGEHDNRSVFENTMPAFRTARDAGAWGLETDIRWTKDLVPMIAHDHDTNRVFGKNLTIAEVSFDELRGALPEIPTLQEFVDEFGGTCHLMIEIKDEEFPDLAKQKAILSAVLSELKPKQDYHLLALDPALFETFDIVPKPTFLPVATFNYKRLSEIALAQGYAGVSGHFLVLSDAIKLRHEDMGQFVGTGFPASQNAFYRELNRGVEYVFTNDALKLLRIIEQNISELTRNLPDD